MKLPFQKIFILAYGLLFFLTPLLVFHKTSELFEFNKMLFIYLIAWVILFVWIVKMILYKQIIIKKTVFDMPLLLFLTTQIISTLISVDRQTSLFGYYGRFNGGLLSLVTYLILYYAFVSNIEIKHVLSLLKISLFSSVLVILIGLPGKLGRDLLCWVFTGVGNNSCWTDQFHPAARMFSTIGQPNWLGAYLAVHFFLALYFFLQKSRSRLYFWLVAGYLPLNFSAILFSRSRSALLAVLVGVGLFLVFLANLSRRQKDFLPLKRIAIYLVCFLIIPILFFKTGIAGIDRYLSSQSPNLKSNNLISNNLTSNITDSFDIRKIVWKGALQLGLKYPLFGTGVETFAYVYYFTRPLVHNLTSEWDFVYNKAHNEYLNYLATTGFFGLIVYLLMVGWVIFVLMRKIFKQPPRLPTDSLVYTLLLSAYLTILITNFFGFSTTTINLFFYLIPAFVVILSAKNSLPSEKKISIITRSQKLLLIAVSFMTAGIITFLGLYFTADIQYARANEYGRADDYETAIFLLTRSLQIHYEHVYEDKLSSLLAAYALISSYQKTAEETRTLVALADRYNTHSLQASPQNVFYWKTRAKNYFLFYQMTFTKAYFNEAIVSIQKAAQLAPTDPRLPYLEALIYSYAHDEAKNKTQQLEYQTASLAAVNRAIQLKNDYRDAFLLKGQLFKKYGQSEEANRAFEYILKYINSDDQEAKKEIKSLY